MKNQLAKLGEFVHDHMMEFISSIAIAFIGYAFYNPALRFVPVDYDDLVLLSSAKNTINPLRFFFSDWGFGNFGYRPLHSISLWIGLKLFGVSSGPNQLINIILHIAVMVLLFMLLKQLSGNRLVAFLSTALVLVSLYTFSPATWISDRPTLFVALFLVGTLYYIFVVCKDRTPNPWILLSISLLALMSKESGLIVPLTTGCILFFNSRTDSRKDKKVTYLGILIVAYIAFRFVIFSGSAGNYEESGYLFGTRYYESSANLSNGELFLSKAENIFKNFIAVVLPLFDGQGKISKIGTLSNSFVLVVSTIIITIVSINRKLTFHQKIGIFIIAVNALIHFHVFRYRTLYLGQIGFALFVASSSSYVLTDRVRTFLVSIFLAILVGWNMHMIGETLTYHYLSRIDYIRAETFHSDILSTSTSIDEEIVDQIIQKYRH
jgi:4-amino-4-deoxy-L-arabinose transferase-like glycosyltransferase